MMLFLFLILLQPFVQLVNCLGPRLISTTVNGMNEVAVKTRRVDTYKGSNAALSCTFSSSLSVKVLWYKDGALFTGGVRRSIIGDYETTSTHRLILPLTNENDSGNYSCLGTVQNSTGDSALFIVKVIGESVPKIRDNYPPAKLILYVSQVFQLACAVSNYHPVNYAWGKESGGIFHNMHILTDRFLKVESAVPENAGNYTCKASNKIGTAHKTVEIIVVGNPSWRTRPQPVTIPLKSTFQLKASFYGSKEGLKVTWFKDGKIIDRAAGWREIKGNNDAGFFETTLKFPSATVQDNGAYSVKIENVNDRIFAEAKVTVNSKPRVVIAEGREIVINKDESVDLTCEVEGYPFPSVRWESDGYTLAKHEAKSGMPSHRFKQTLVLVVRSVRQSKAFVCSADNSLGRSEELITVKLNGIHRVTTTKPKKLEDNAGDRQTFPMEIVIPTVAAVIVVLIILVLIYMIRRKKRSNFSDDGVLFKRDMGSFRVDDDDDNVELIAAPVCISPVEQPVFEKLDRRKQPEKMSIRRQNLMFDSVKKQDLTPNDIYAEVFPVGQGRNIRFEDMNLVEVCGSGNFGVVVKGTLEEEGDTSKEIAVKMLKESAGPVERKMVLDELQVLKALSPHPNIVGLVGWCITAENVYIVEEFVPNGSLLNHLRSMRTDFYSSYVNLREVTKSKCDVNFLLFAWQISSGMKYLSSQSIIHRDLATRNIILGHENVCKISDFGLARTIYQNANYKKTGEGQLPVRWMAPESIFNGVYSTATDVWSFGIVLWEIATLGEIPYPELPRVEHLITMLKNKKRMAQPAHCSTALYQLMRSCWNEVPCDRPDFNFITQELSKMVNGGNIYLDMPKFFDDLASGIKADEDDSILFGTDADPSMVSDRI